MKDMLKKLVSEKAKTPKITIKTYLNYDESKLIVQVVAPNRLIEKNYPNNDMGQDMMKKFVSRFKTLKDIENYLYNKE